MNRFWEPLILGVLAEEGTMTGYRSIFVNNSNELQFSIQIISTPPYSFPNSQRMITCWGSDLEEHGFEDDLFDKEARVNSLKNFLEGKLLVFQIEKRTGPKSEYFTAKNIRLIAKKLSFTSNMGYSPVPVYVEKQDKVNPDDYTWDQFISNLSKGLYIGRNEQVSREPEDTPRYLFYKSLENEYFIVGEFEGHHYAHGGFSFTAENSAYKFKQLAKETLQETYFFDSIAFVGIDEEHEIITALQQQEEIVSTKQVAEVNDEKVAVSEEVNISEDIKGSVEVEVESSDASETEEAFMKQFIAETKKMNLTYNMEDLYNFHTCMKTGGLTILAGMSGTGKSQLINAYQKGLHLDSDKFLMVPVSPTWTDDSDLLGYPDIMNNVYRAADSGVVNLLIEAAEKPTETFIVCFDEMNLAKVEHYFSQFLSVLEMEKGRRKLKLYNEDLQNKFYNGSQYPHEVLIGENVLFTGTVNLDESTHHFSDKVLDRSNLMTLHVEPFTRLLELEKSMADKTEVVPKQSYTIQEFVQQDRKMVLSESELAFLWEVHEALIAISTNMGIGPRVVRQIDRYIKNLGTLSTCPIDRKLAFDLQFAQRILSKFRGSEDILKDLVGVYDAENQNVESSQLIDLFDKYAAHSEFKKSRALIREKAKELMRNGYAF